MDGRVIGFARRGNAEFRDFSIFLSGGGGERERERRIVIAFLSFFSDFLDTLYHVCNIYILLVRFNSYRFTTRIEIMEN